MERSVLPLPNVVKLLKKFVTVQLYTDRVDISSITAEQREALAVANQERIIELAREATNPFYVVLSPSGEVLGRLGGYNEPQVFVDFLSQALKKLPSDMKVTQAESRSTPIEQR
jgi:thiol:disulfide interchange protein DsbD